MTTSDNLDRFLEAQSSCYEKVCAELRAGKKTSHWMWFIFPQLEGLGQSTMAKRYAIRSRQEAIHYRQHPLLGPRLIECVGLMLGTKSKTAFDILGTPDDLKLRSCMTLFAAVATEEPLFKQALSKFYEGKTDPRTLELLGRL